MLTTRDNNVLETILNSTDGEINLITITGEEEEQIDNGLLCRAKQLENEAVQMVQGQDVSIEVYQRAIKLLDNAIEMVPRYGSLYNNRAQMKRLQGKFKEAFQDVEKAIEFGDSSVLKQAYMQRAILHKQNNNQMLADLDFKKAASFGNLLAKSTVKENPYAKMCNQMLTQVMNSH